MLDYKKNRLDYGKQLNPPEGFVMERAVATTYSLDLTAFLSIPVALFYKRNLDGKVSEDRMDIFDSIQKTSHSITIYCQKGKLKVPKSNNRIISFIEDSVVEVLPANAFTSFHPKIWVIRYKNAIQDVLYRVIVLSRNLTFDRSWDVAFKMEGYVTSHQNAKSKPLADFIRHLTSYHDFDKSTEFINELEKVNFEIDNCFNDFQFHPTGFGNYNNPLKKEKWNDLIIVSPFLDRAAVEGFLQAITGKAYLFSRREDLDKIHMKTLQRFNKVYAFSQNIVEGEEYDEIQEEADDIPMQQNLHAKLFIGSSFGGQNKWFIGSANCSKAAMDRNEEFVIELLNEESHMSIGNVLNTLLGKGNEIEFFREYSRERLEPASSDEYDFRATIFRLLNYLQESDNFKTKCTLSNGDKVNYNIGIILKNCDLFEDKELQYSLAPYGWKGDLTPVVVEEEILFKHIPIHHLSPFFIWKVFNQKKNQEKNFITRLPILLPDQRKQAIFKSIIKDKNRFIQLIQFLLGANNDTLLFRDQRIRKVTGKMMHGTLLDVNSSMYEEMLIAASRNVDKLRDIENLINKLRLHNAEDVIPEEFNMIWGVFKQMIPDA